MTRVIDRGTSQAKSMYVGSAIDDSDLDVYEFRVYAHLKRRAQDGVVWEKQENMATICKMSRPKLNRVLISLEEKKWIEQEARMHKGQQTTNLIYLLEPPCKPQLHGRVTDDYTAVYPTVTAKGTPLEGTPQQASGRDDQHQEPSEGKAAEPARPTPTPDTPSQEPQPTDDEAVRFFDALCGYGFVSRYRNHLARWHGEYTAEWLRMAWKTAPTLKDVRVPTVAFVWLLNREKPWPDALSRQYGRDQAVPAAPGGTLPFVGEVRTMKDGRSGPVLDIDTDERKLTLQVGADASDSVWVPWSVTEPVGRVG